MKTVTFEAIEGENGEREGEDGWRVLVDGKEIIEKVRDTDIAANHFDVLWNVLGIKVEFDYD